MVQIYQSLTKSLKTYYLAPNPSLQFILLLTVAVAVAVPVIIAVAVALAVAVAVAVAFQKKVDNGGCVFIL